MSSHLVLYLRARKIQKMETRPIFSRLELNIWNREYRVIFYSIFELVKKKEGSEFTSLESLKFPKRIKKRGKKLRSTSFLPWQQSFESPLNIHKMSSQVICHPFWVLEWTYEPFYQRLLFGHSSDWLSFQSYGEFVNASCIPNISCQCCLSHTCVVFVQRTIFPVLALSSYPFLIYPDHSQCRVVYQSEIDPLSVWWSFLHLVRWSKTPVGLWHIIILSFPAMCIEYLLLHWQWYMRVSHTFYICDMDPLCIVRGHDRFYFCHGSAMYNFGCHVYNEHGYAHLRDMNWNIIFDCLQVSYFSFR